MSAVRTAILAEAQRWLGTPYRHQGSRRGVGADCLGFVRGVWRAVYGSEPAETPTYSIDWAEGGGADRLLDAAQALCVERGGTAEPGNLILFRWRDGALAKHCGIMAEGQRFYHAYDRHAVLLSPLVPSWRRRIAGVFIFPETGSE